MLLLLITIIIHHLYLRTEFIKTYANLGADIASYGGPDWSTSTPGQNDGKFGPGTGRDKKKGSPVVPGSHFKILTEGEYIMFSIVILRGQYEAGKYEGEIFVPGEIFSIVSQNLYVKNHIRLRFVV